MGSSVATGNGSVGSTDVGASQVMLKESVAANIRNPDVISEAALWMHYFHDGNLRCTTHCEILTIQREALIESIAWHLLPQQMFGFYARRFVSAAHSILTAGEIQYLDLVNTRHVLEQESV